MTIQRVVREYNGRVTAAKQEAMDTKTLFGIVTKGFESSKVANFVYILMSIFSFGIVNLVNYFQTKNVNKRFPVS